MQVLTPDCVQARRTGGQEEATVLCRGGPESEEDPRVTAVTAPRPSGGAAAVRAWREAEGEGGQGKAQGQRKGPGLLPGGSVLETRAPSLGREDPLEEAMATHSSVLAWRIPWTEEPGGLQSTGVAESRKRLSTHAQGH